MSTGLFFWAVLNGMTDMAKFLISLDNQECAKALIAAEISSKLADSDKVSGSDRRRKTYTKAAL